MEDTLLDAKEDLIELVMEFINGNKRKIYDSIISCQELLTISEEPLP